MIKRQIVLAALFVCFFRLPSTAGDKLWQKEVDDDITFKKLHQAGVLIVGTDDTFYGFEPRTGKEIWKVEDVAKSLVDKEMLVAMPPLTPYLIFEQEKGFMGSESIVRCIDVTTGKTVWDMSNQAPEASAYRILEKKTDELPEVRCRFLQKVGLDPAHNQLLLAFEMVNLFKGKAGKSGPETFMGLVGVDVGTGKINFIFKLDDEPEGYYPWKGQYPPVIKGDVGMIDWAGYHSFSVLDGKPIVSLQFARGYKRGMLSRYIMEGTNAPMVVEGNIAYVVAKDQVIAVDTQTGKKKWESEELDGALPEMHLVGNRIVLRMGGVFASGFGSSREYKELKPYGVAILDKETGKKLSDTEKMNDDWEINSISPLLVDKSNVYFGTRNSVRAVDIDKLQYKYNTDLGIEDGDMPRSVTMHDGQLIYLGEQMTAAINPVNGEVLWKKYVEPPELDWGMAFARSFAKAVAAMDILSRTATAAKEGGVSVLEEMDINQRIKEWNSFAAGFDAMSQRIAALNTASQYNYVMAGETKDPEILGISLTDGQQVRKVKVMGRVPDYFVDEGDAILVCVAKSDQEILQVYSLK